MIQWGTHGLIEIGVRPVTERSLVRTTPWLFYVVCCARRQGALSLLSQSIKLQLDTNFLWELTSDRLVSYPGKVNDSNPLSTTETGEKHWPYVPSWPGEGFHFFTTKRISFFVLYVYFDLLNVICFGRKDEGWETFSP